MRRIIFIVAIWLAAAGGATAAPASGSFEDELDIVDQSYFIEQGYAREEPRPRTVTLRQASWAPFNVKTGFVSAHLMTEPACRNFLRNLRADDGTACMNVHNGRIFYPQSFIGPMLP